MGMFIYMELILHFALRLEPECVKSTRNVKTYNKYLDSLKIFQCRLNIRFCMYLLQLQVVSMLKIVLYTRLWVY